MIDPTESEKQSLRARSVRRVLSGASKLLSRSRLREAARSKVDPGAVQDHLLIEAQKATFREMHRRFTERAGRGEAGIASAVEALDAMWLNVRQLRAGAPRIIGTLSSPNDDVQAHLSRFYVESTDLLEDAIRAVFATDLGQLALPPDRMAVLVRVILEGLIVELAQARDADDVVIADQAYADVRSLFERFVLLGGDAPEIEPLELEPIPLPW